MGLSRRQSVSRREYKEELFRRAVWKTSMEETLVVEQTGASSMPGRNRFGRPE